jgi:hypothetical protein
MGTSPVTETEEKISLISKRANGVPDAGRISSKEKPIKENIFLFIPNLIGMYLS